MHLPRINLKGELKSLFRNIKKGPGLVMKILDLWPLVEYVIDHMDDMGDWVLELFDVLLKGLNLLLGAAKQTSTKLDDKMVEGCITGVTKWKKAIQDGELPNLDEPDPEPVKAYKDPATGRIVYEYEPHPDLDVTELDKTATPEPQ